jgi:hypothetical protein
MDAQFVATVTVEDGKFVARCSCGWASKVRPWSDHKDRKLADIATIFYADAIKHHAEHGFPLPERR